MTDKIDIFNDNAEFFERFSNSDNTTTKDRLGRDRKTISGIEKDVSNSLSGAIEGINTATQDAIDAVNNMGESVGTGKVVRESDVKRNSLMDSGAYYTPTTPPPKLKAGDSGLIEPSLLLENNQGLDFTGLGAVWVHFYVQANYINNEKSLVAFFNGYGDSNWYISSTDTDGVWSKPSRFYGTHNTVVDSNGNLKAASPVLRLFNDRIETNDQFTEEPMFEKIGAGTYKISNTLGLAQEGWYIETPKDKNGLPYFMVDWEQDEESHDVIIRVFKKKLDLEALDFVRGEPVDISEEQRWIDLRFHEEEQRLDNE